MAGDMIEARKHIEALFRVIGGVHGAFGAESCEYCASVSAAQAFLTRLDGEGQRVEDPAFDAALAKVISERMPGLVEYDNHHNARLCPYCSPDREAEQSDIRNAALEEAVALCVTITAAPDSAWDEKFVCGWDTALQTVASGIRALISQPNGGQT